MVDREGSNDVANNSDAVLTITDAIDQLQLSNDVALTTSTEDDSNIKITNKKKSYKLNRQSARHGSRNQDRHKQLAKWLINEFDHQLQKPSADDSQAAAPTILDIGGGGKGELSSRLVMCHRLNVIAVDPRPALLESTFVNLVLPKLPKKHQQRIQGKLDASPDFVSQIVEERFQQLTMYFDDQTCDNSKELQMAIEKSDLVVGMHADGAVEPIVDACLARSKAFVVIPCCVFPNFFPNRRLVNGKPVRTWEQFCDYLMQKDPRLERHVLPFQGRNVAILWKG